MKTPKEQLMEIESFEERIKLVAQDVENKTDVFSEIPTSELLDLLGNDYSLNSTLWWNLPDMQTMLDSGGDLTLRDQLYRLQGEVEPKRYEELLRKAQEVAEREKQNEDEDEDWGSDSMSDLELRPKEEDIIAKSMFEDILGTGEQDQVAGEPLRVDTITFAEGVVFEGSSGTGGWEDLYGPYEIRDRKGFDLDGYLEGETF